MKLPEAYRTVARLAASAGWRITRLGSGHLRWESPDGAVVITPSTPSCKRGVANAKARLRRAGLAVR